MPVSGERIVLGNLPIFHAFGICVFITTSLGRPSKFVLLQRFVEEDFLRCIQVIPKHNFNINLKIIKLKMYVLYFVLAFSRPTE